MIKVAIFSSLELSLGGLTVFGARNFDFGIL